MTTQSDLGTSDQAIADAAAALNVAFPDALIKVWKVSNGLDLPDSWRVYPVFDPVKPQMSRGHIVEENSAARWPNMQDDLVAIASNAYGDRLVLRREGGKLGDTVYLWDHKTNTTSKHPNDLVYILGRAEARVTSIADKMK